MISLKKGKRRMQTVLATRRPFFIFGMRLGLFYCLILLATAPNAFANDPHPLAPPDRSSPRATLQSFITHMNAAHRA